MRTPRFWQGWILAWCVSMVTAAASGHAAPIVPAPPNVTCETSDSATGCDAPVPGEQQVDQGPRLDPAPVPPPAVPAPGPGVPVSPPAAALVPLSPGPGGDVPIVPANGN